MSPDRAEIAGTGAALAFHAALIAALSLSLAHVAKVPEPPAMEVELVDEVGLEAAAPAALAVPPPPSTAPEISQADATEPAPPPTAAPLPPAAKVVPAPARPAPKASRIGADFLKGIAADAPSKANAPARPAAAHFDAAAKADVASAIAAQIRPCALSQQRIGNGAERMKVVLRLHLFLSGRLKGAPEIVRIDGRDDDNKRYADVASDQAIAVFRQCSPLRLPPELYSTPDGGWGDFQLNYHVK